MRFKFHFMAKALTNRLDKPAWFFSNILSTIERHSPFLDLIIQPLFDKEKINMNAKVNYTNYLKNLYLVFFFF